MIKNWHYKNCKYLNKLQKHIFTNRILKQTTQHEGGMVVELRGTGGLEKRGAPGFWLSIR